MTSTTDELIWHKELEPDELSEGRVKPATCAQLSYYGIRHEGAAIRPKFRHSIHDRHPGMLVAGIQ